jgi:hypothetical protein
VVMGAVFGLVNPSSIASRAQPEAIDVQQRARVAGEALQRDLSMAGAGPRSGPATGSLSNHVAAVIPRRMGLQGSGAHTVARSTRSRSTGSPRGNCRRPFWIRWPPAPSA